MIREGEIDVIVKKNLTNVKEQMNKSIEDCLIIGVDFSLYDKDYLVVFRKNGDETYIINKFKDNEAVEIYNKLIGKYKEIKGETNND